jgi:FkbM family methyltransferase
MIRARLLSPLGRAAELARRAGVGREVNFSIDAIDAVLLRAGTPILKATNGSVELRGFLRHRGFLEYVSDGMREESHYQRLLVTAVDSDTTFVDPGAHIGVYTILMCPRARRVLAFEPDPYNVAALKRNVKDCGYANVEIRAEAVADRAGHAPFRAFRSSFSGSLVPRQVDAYEELDVYTVPLDDALDDSDLASLVVKLDVEGAEPLALLGMGRTIQRASRLALFAEVNPEALEAGGSSPERLAEELLATEMDCAWIDEQHRALVPLPTTRRLAKGNVMCVKGSKE